MLKEGQKCTIKCEEMNNFGNVVCRIDGIVVFINGAVSGDVVEVEIKKITSNYAIAETTKIISQSPYRITPSCTVYDRCGGCVFSMININKENEIKTEYVKGTLKKFGIEAMVDDIVCPVHDFYRNKVILFYANGRFGYMERASNRVVPHKSCPLNDGIFDDIARFTAKELDDKKLRALYLRKSSAESGEIMVCPIFSKPTDIKHYAKKLKNEFSRVSTVLSGHIYGKDFVLEACEFETVRGDGYIRDTICGLTFEISPKSFYQINHACATELYEKAISYLDADENSQIADLFCGTGTIGMIVAKRTGAKVYGVEIEPSAVEDAKRNAKHNGVSNIEFFEGDAKNFNKKVDACIIDPPRKGCSDFMLDTLLRLNPKKIIYVSCNPDTMARDLKKLTRKYKITEPISVFNMFPKTGHIESVVCLTRK